MGTPAGLVGRSEAARLLHVHPRTIASMVKQGMLKQVVRERKSYISRAEIVALGLVFNGKTDYSSILNLAIRAYMKADAAEKRVREMADLLGLDAEPLESDEGSIVTLYENVKKRLSEKPPVDALEVRILARRLHGISEEYLRLVEHYTCDDEPWRSYLELAGYLSVNAPRSYFPADQELATAYGYLEAARRHLRAVAYQHVRIRYGRDEANQAFIGTHMADDLIATMFPH